MKADRIDELRSAAAEGKVNIRERENKERCPNCEGFHDEVYQYAEGHREEANLYDHDDRWFCFCGWAEKPSEGTTLAEWRTT